MSDKNENHHESKSQKLIPAAEPTPQAPTDYDMPTAQEIANLTMKAVDNCERAAVSFEEIAAAGERLNAGLRRACDEGAQLFRDRGKAQATLITNFAKYVDQQCATVRHMHEQAEIASPSSPKQRPPSERVSFFAPRMPR